MELISPAAMGATVTHNIRDVLSITSVVVAGLRSQLGASNRMLTLVAERLIQPLVTTALFLEYENVLNRPEQKKRHTEEQIDAVAGNGALHAPLEALRDYVA